MTPPTSSPAPAGTSPPDVGVSATPGLERRGRAWLLWSFLLCPCHLPLTLAALTAVLAGTSLGVTLRDHLWLAGAIITTAWLAGTGYGFRLIRQAEKADGACPVRTRHAGSDRQRRRLLLGPDGRTVAGHAEKDP